MSAAPLALALLAASAAAAVKDPWIRIASPHFEVFTDAGERAGRDVARHFEQVHGFFLQRFKTGIDPDRKALVILFRNEREYQPYRPNQFAAAFFHAGEFRDFIVLHNAVNDWRPTAVHELTHLMVHELGGELPLWLNEGLAELYSNMEPRGAQVMVGRDLPGRLQALAAEPWIALPALLAVDHESPLYNDPARAGMFYAESWKLVHMLHLDPAYEPHLGDLLAGLLKGDAASAFRAAYGKDLAQVERDLRGYLSGNTIGALLFDIPLPKAVNAAETEGNAGMGARLALAELLTNTAGRSAQAAAAYDSLARDYPERWEVEAARGRFAWHERRMDDAAAHFAKAEQMGCEEGAMYLLWGRVLGYSNRIPEAAAVLGKAAQRLPDSPAAQLEYGNVLVRNGEWAKGAAVLRAVKNVPPASAWRYWYNLAYALYREGDTAAAGPLVARARQYAAGARENGSLDQLQAALDRAAARTEQMVEGTVESVECGTLARLHVRVAGELRTFVMPRAAGPLGCGVQADAPRVRILYQAMPELRDAAGVVRRLEFR